MGWAACSAFSHQQQTRNLKNKEWEVKWIKRMSGRMSDTVTLMETKWKVYGSDVSRDGRAKEYLLDAALT